MVPVFLAFQTGSEGLPERFSHELIHTTTCYFLFFSNKFNNNNNSTETHTQCVCMTRTGNSLTFFFRIDHLFHLN